MLEKVNCPHCARPFTATDKNLNREMRCFFCGCMFKVVPVEGHPDEVNVELVSAPKKFEPAPAPSTESGASSASQPGLPIQMVVGVLVGIVLIVLILIVLGGRRGANMRLRDSENGGIRLKNRRAAEMRRGEDTAGPESAAAATPDEEPEQPGDESPEPAPLVSPFESRPSAEEDTPPAPPSEVIRSPFESPGGEPAPEQAD